MNENSSEFGIRAPQLTKSHLERVASVVPTEYPPLSCMEHVVVNPILSDVLPKDIASQFTEDKLLTMPQFTVPRESKRKGILVPDSWNRALVLAYGEIPIADRIILGTVAAKGCGFSGESHHKGSVYPYKTGRGDPIGLFGHRDADDEIEIGNRLLTVDFRTSVPVGYVQFNPDKLGSWYENIWRQYDKKRAEIISESFNQIKINGDRPVFFIRVCGVTSRLDETVSDPDTAMLRSAGERRRAARLMLRESNTFPEHFQKYLTYNITMPEIQSVFLALAHGKYLNRSNRSIMARFMQGVIDSNAQALEPMFLSMMNDGLLFSDFASANFSAPKDISDSLEVQDFESLIKRVDETDYYNLDYYDPSKKNVQQLINDYVVRMDGVMSDYLRLLSTNKTFSSLSEFL